MTKQPMRMCCVCRRRDEKDQLLRVARTPQGEYQIDTLQVLQGRGAYLCKTPECFERAIKRHCLEKSFRMKVPVEVYQELEKERKPDG